MAADRTRFPYSPLVSDLRRLLAHDDGVRAADREPLHHLIQHPAVRQRLPASGRRRHERALVLVLTAALDMLDEDMMRAALRWHFGLAPESESNKAAQRRAQAVTLSGYGPYAYGKDRRNRRTNAWDKSRLTRALERVEGFLDELVDPAANDGTAAQARSTARREGGSSSHSLEFHTTMIAHVRAVFERGDYAAVLRYREAFSRLLWIEGRISERLQLGALVEEAALHLEAKEAQAAALIDDLGWTSVASQRHSEAEVHLRHGLRVARAAGLSYWEAKAHRHLGGLMIERKEYEQARTAYHDSRTRSEDIEPTLLRKEFQAGLEHDLALLEYLADALDAALEHLATSVRLREEVGDPSRTVRIRSLRGKILERQGEYALAKDEFRFGLAESRRVGRRDEQIRNLRGLARVLRREGSATEADSCDSEAEELEAQTPVPFERA